MRQAAVAVTYTIIIVKFEEKVNRKRLLFLRIANIFKKAPFPQILFAKNIDRSVFIVL